MSSLYFLVFLFQLCTSILAAPLSTAPSLGLLNSDALNITSATNNTSPNKSKYVTMLLAAYASVLTSPSLGVLPSDPLSRHFPGSPFTIFFRNYTISISRSDCARCVEAAYGDVFAHGDRMNSRVGSSREYAWGTVELSISPRHNMRWMEMWFVARSIKAWLKVYDAVDMNFDVLVNGLGVVGTGRLANII